jgi:hypothetical protein
MPAGSEQDKQVKLSFVVDTASLAQARQAIGELINLSTRLAQTLKNTSFGGGGGNSGSTVPQWQSLLSGGGVGVTPLPSQVVATSAGSLAAPIVGNATALTQAANLGKDALRDIGDAFSASMTRQGQELDRLLPKLRDYTAAMHGLGGGKGFQGLFDPRGNRIPPGGGGGGDEGGAPGEPVVPSSPGPGRPPRTWGGQSSWGRTLPMMAGGVMSAVDESIAYPGRYLGAEAAQANTWSGLYRQAVGGDVTGTNAMLNIFADAEKRADWQTASQQGWLTRIQNGYQSLNMSQVMNWGMLGGAGGAAAGLTAGGIGAIPGAAAGALGGAAGGLFMQFPKFLSAMSDAATTTSVEQRLMKQIQDQMASTPEENIAIERLTSGAAGSLSGQRAIGIANRSDRPGRGQAYERFVLDNLTAKGYDVGALAGAISGVAGAGAGWNAASRGLGYQAMVGASAHIPNASALTGMAALGGNPKEFMGMVYGGAGGEGLLDPTAMGLTAAGVASGIGSTGIFTSGVGALQAALTSLGDATGGPQDIIRARQFSAGQGLAQSFSSGGLDRWQYGQNIVGAIQAGVKDPYVQEWLATKMTPTVIADIMKMRTDAELPPEFKVRGVTLAQAQSWVRHLGKSMFTGITDTGAQSPMMNRLRAIRASGTDPLTYLSGLKGADRAAAREEVGALMQSRTGATDSESEGAAAWTSALGLPMGKHHLGEPKAIGGPNDVQAQILADQAAAAKKILDQTESLLPDILGKMKLLPEAADFASGHIHGLGADAGVASRELRAFARTLEEIRYGMSGRKDVNQHMREWDEANKPQEEKGVAPGAAANSGSTPFGPRGPGGNTP